MFSDCLLWLAGEEADKGWGMSGWGAVENSNASASLGARPGITRSRSKSEAELTAYKSRVRADSDTPSTPPPSPPGKRNGLLPARKSYQPPSNHIKRNASTTNTGGGGDERWVYKGRAELVDLEVIVSPPRDLGEERRLEILSPEGSFVLYAGASRHEHTSHPLAQISCS